MNTRRILRTLALVALLASAAPTIATSDHGADQNRQGEISPTRDLTIPAAWSGEWRITTTYRRGDTNEVMAIDDVTDVIRANEPLGLSALTRGGLMHCQGIASSGRLKASCSARFSDARCRAGGSFAIAIERAEETLLGFGEAISGSSAGCGALPPGGGRTTVEVVGFRTGPDPGPATEVRSPLLTRFVASSPPLLMAVSARQVRPVIKADCRDGRWSTFTNPAFKNQGECIRFVEKRNEDDDRHAPQGRGGER